MKRIKLFEDYSENGSIYRSEGEEKSLISKLNDDVEFMNKIKEGIKYAAGKYNVDPNTIWSSLKGLIH